MLNDQTLSIIWISYVGAGVFIDQENTKHLFIYNIWLYQKNNLLLNVCFAKLFFLIFNFSASFIIKISYQSLVYMRRKSVFPLQAVIILRFWWGSHCNITITVSPESFSLSRTIKCCFTVKLIILRWPVTFSKQLSLR